MFDGKISKEYLFGTKDKKDKKLFNIIKEKIFHYDITE